LGPITTVVADDNPTVCALFRSLLKNLGYTVTGEFNEAKSVIGFLEKNQPEVLILDIDMPGIGGMPGLQSILKQFPHIFVVVTMLDEQRATLKQVFDIGAAGCLVKPFKSDAIARMFAQLAKVMVRVRAGNVVSGSVSAGLRKRAVVVDHSLAMQALICTLLEEGGYEVAAVANSGMKGLLAIEQHRPHFVCLDGDMPDLNGLSTLACLHACHPTLPVIMITGRSDSATVQQAAEQHVAGYILKPIEPDKLLESIRRALIRPR
jgi:two-component system chemotaxis response regulator CheY